MTDEEFTEALSNFYLELLQSQVDLAEYLPVLTEEQL